MAALTAATQRRIRKLVSITENFRVANGVTIYHGSFCGIPGTSGLTSNRGYLVKWQNIATLQWAGLAIGSPFNQTTVNTVVGDTSASPVVEATVEAGPFILIQHTVTGVSAQADVGKAVYASNDNDLTLTANLAPAVGRVEYWHTSTTADVLFYGRVASLVI